jgi:uncharacterized membrane protein
MGALVAVNVPLTGSYTSAVFRYVPVYPPVISTLPLGSSVAVWEARNAAMGLLIVVNAPLTGSYSSAVFDALLMVLDPAAISTFPSASSVAE